MKLLKTQQELTKVTVGPCQLRAWSVTSDSTLVPFRKLIPGTVVLEHQAWSSMFWLGPDDDDQRRRVKLRRPCATSRKKKRLQIRKMFERFTIRQRLQIRNMFERFEKN